VRDKLQPVEDSDLSENPINPIISGCRIKACPGRDPGFGMTVLGLLTSISTFYKKKLHNSNWRTVRWMTQDIPLGL